MVPSNVIIYNSLWPGDQKQFTMPYEVYLMQCEEIYVAEENSQMEWSDIVFETMEWANIEMETYVRPNNFELCDVNGLDADMNYEMEWQYMELETDRVYMKYEWINSLWKQEL